MTQTSVTLRKKDAIFDELQALQEQVRQRAYDLFRNRGSLFGGSFEDWLNAEHEIVWKPAIELRRTDGQFDVRVATAGVEPRDLDVEVTPEDLLIKADITHTHADQKGRVEVCEFASGRLFRSIHFPERIDPDSMKAEYRNGLLHLTASIAKATTKKVEIAAA